jgi:hypothetical protein
MCVCLINIKITSINAYVIHGVVHVLSMIFMNYFSSERSKATKMMRTAANAKMINMCAANTIFLNL